MMFVMLLPGLVIAQPDINTFDEAPADTNYWKWYDHVNGGATTGPGGHYQISSAADPDTGWIQVSYVDDPVLFGTGAMKVDYSVHNTESWGGYSKIEHWHPDTNAVYDFTGFDSISVMYYNSVPQSLAGRITFRLCLHDVSHAENGNATYSNEECEYYYSFLEILDSDPGWNEIKMPLVNNYSWNGQGFNLTGWSGINGNAELDLDKIKGFAFEYSISGGGNGDFSAGTIVFDHLTLKGAAGIELVFFNGKNLPGNVELYGGWGGGSYEITDEEAYTPGTNSIKWNTPPNDWAVWDGLVFTLSAPKNLMVNWPTDSVRLKIKADAGIGDLKLVFSDPDEDEAGPDLEFEAGYVLEEAVIGHDGTWKVVAVALKDFNRFEGGWDGSQTQPGEMDSTKVERFKILIASTAAVGKVVYLDDIWTGNPEIDVLPPEAPTSLSAVPADYYNLIIWEDVAGESGESYTVYTSLNPIEDLSDPDVDVVAKGVLENTQTAVHWLYYPIVDTDVDYYYAITCKDEAGNDSPTFTTMASAVTNTAKGIATISLNPPVDFAADGDFSEWEGSGIMPFVITPETGHVPAGTVTDSDDLTGTVYLAVDNDNLYVAVDVIDDVYFYGAGNWWDHDAFQMFIGLYDQRGPTHTSIMRGAEPDLIMYGVEDRLELDYAGMGALYTPEDDNYYFEELGGADYLIEAKIPLDSLVAEDDARFSPVRGMRIPIDLYFHDNDGAGWEGNLGLSPNSTDHQWQSPSEWTFTWVGDTTHVTAVEEADNTLVITSYSLSQNYPNPFNPTTTIHYSVAKAGQVKVELYNMLGQKLKTLVNTNKPAGRYTIDFDGKDLTSGIYFYRIKAGSFTKTKKMVLMK